MSDPSDLRQLMADAVDGLTPRPPPLADLEAVQRRRRRRWVTAGAVTSVVVLAIVGWAAAGLGGPGHQTVRVGPVGSTPSATAKSTATTHPATTRAAPAVGSNVFAQPLEQPMVTVAGSGLYVAWQVSPPGAPVRSELARVDAATGRIEAISAPGAGFDQPLEAAGSLWVTTSAAAGEELLRLDPQTLQVTGRWPLGGLANQAWAAHDLAVAGGRLWVAAGNRLLQVALPAGGVTLTVPLPGAYSSDVAADAAGTILVDGQANSSGTGAVQRRNPTTGALLASHPMSGVAAPVVAGVVGPSVWVSEATGMMGYVERLDATTLSPSPSDRSTCQEGKSTPTCLFGTNGITVTLADRHVWITQTNGGNARNYCANASTGQILGTLARPQPAEDTVLAIGPDQIYYTFYAAVGLHLAHQLIPPACQTT